jgi:hypothetical protein
MINNAVARELAPAGLRSGPKEMNAMFLKHCNDRF